MLHATIDPWAILEAAEDSEFGIDYRGFCIACGEEAYGVEPDASHYECEECGEFEVFGAPELLIMGYAG